MERRYKVVPSVKFDRSTRRAVRRGKDIKKLAVIIDMIARGERLLPKYHDHALSDSRKYKDCRECHIEPDWLLVYRIDHGELILVLVETGSHSDLF